MESRRFARKSAQFAAHWDQKESGTNLSRPAYAPWHFLILLPAPTDGSGGVTPDDHQPGCDGKPDTAHATRENHSAVCQAAGEVKWTTSCVAGILEEVADKEPS